MIKTYCDHCRKELDIKERLLAVELKYSFFRGGVIHPLNLCPDCLKEFKELVQNFTKVENEE